MCSRESIECRDLETKGYRMPKTKKFQVNRGSLIFVLGPLQLGTLVSCIESSSHRSRR